MAHGGSYTKKNKEAKPELVERTKTIAEHDAEEKAKAAAKAKKTAGDK